MKPTTATLAASVSSAASSATRKPVGIRIGRSYPDWPRR
jgi:hypothetical protein